MTRTPPGPTSHGVDPKTTPCTIYRSWLVVYSSGRGVGSTSRRLITFEDRLLKSCAQNAVAIRVALLSEPWNKTVFGIVKESLKPMLTRDINCRKHCKNADGVQAWVVDPSRVGIMADACSLVNTYAKHDVTLKEPIILPVFSVTHRAKKFVWPSVAWQIKYLPLVTEPKKELLAVVDMDKDYDLLELAADNGFWDMSVPTVRKFVGLRGVFMEDDGSDCIWDGWGSVVWVAGLPCQVGRVGLGSGSSRGRVGVALGLTPCQVGPGRVGVWVESGTGGDVSGTVQIAMLSSQVSQECCMSMIWEACANWHIG